MSLRFAAARITAGRRGVRFAAALWLAWISLVSLRHPGGGRLRGKIVSVLVGGAFAVVLLGQPSSPGGWSHSREDRVCAGQGAVRGRSSWSAFVTPGGTALNFRDLWLFWGDLTGRSSWCM